MTFVKREGKALPGPAGVCACAKACAKHEPGRFGELQRGQYQELEAVQGGNKERPGRGACFGVFRREVIQSDLLS